jgi:aconitate hydratase
MAFDIEMIKALYETMPSKVEAARKQIGRPLTLTEKILYSHLHIDQKSENFQNAYEILKVVKIDLFLNF